MTCRVRVCLITVILFEALAPTVWTSHRDSVAISSPVNNRGGDGANGYFIR